MFLNCCVQSPDLNIAERILIIFTAREAIKIKINYTLLVGGLFLFLEFVCNINIHSFDMLHTYRRTLMQIHHTQTSLIQCVIQNVPKAAHEILLLFK